MAKKIQEECQRKHKLKEKMRENLAFYPFFKKKKFGNMPLFPNYIRACPCFETRFYQNQVMPDQTIKKKKRSMKLDFREIEFQNATIGL